MRAMLLIMLATPCLAAPLPPSPDPDPDPAPAWHPPPGRYGVDLGVGRLRPREAVVGPRGQLTVDGVAWGSSRSGGEWVIAEPARPGPMLVQYVWRLRPAGPGRWAGEVRVFGMTVRVDTVWRRLP